MTAAALLIGCLEGAGGLALLDLPLGKGLVVDVGAADGVLDPDRRPRGLTRRRPPPSGGVGDERLALLLRADAARRRRRRPRY